MVLVDSSYDSGKSEVLFVNIGAMVLDLQLDTSFVKGFGPKLAKASFRPQTPNVTASRSKNFFFQAP